MHSVDSVAGDEAWFGPITPRVCLEIADVDPVEIFPGITARLLWQGADGAKAAVTTIAPGAVWGDEDHHSPGPEEVYVVSGVFNDGVNDYPAGTSARAGGIMAHSAVGAPGCVLFLFYPQG